MTIKKRLIFFVMAFLLALSSLALLFTPSNYKLVSADSLEDRYNLVVYPSLDTTLNNLGITIKNDGDYLYIDGAKNTAKVGYLSFSFPLSAGTYTFNINAINYLSYFFTVADVRYNFNNQPMTFSVDINTNFELTFVTAIGAVFNGEQIRPMLNKGSISYPFVIPLSSNPDYYLGLQNGYNQGYQDSLKENSFADITDLAGVFAYADFSFYTFSDVQLNEFGNINLFMSNFSRYPLSENLTDYSYIKGHNNGFTALGSLNIDSSFSFVPEDVLENLGSDNYIRYRILFDEAVNFRQDLSVLSFWGNKYSPYKVTSFVDRVDFPIFAVYYSDGTNFITFSQEFSNILELDNNKFVVAIDIMYRGLEKEMPSLIPIFDDTSYQNGYQNGLQDGNKLGYENGFLNGQSSGYDKGYRDGLKIAEDSDLVGFISAVVGAPVTVVSKFLNFQILGINILGFVSGLLTLLLVVKVISIFLGRK